VKTARVTRGRPAAGDSPEPGSKAILRAWLFSSPAAASQPPKAVAADQKNPPPWRANFRASRSLNNFPVLTSD